MAWRYPSLSSLASCVVTLFRYMLNVWDVGGQQTIRSYWRNYFEQVRPACDWLLFWEDGVLMLSSVACPRQTDGLIWVVDSADKRRIEDCKKELHGLLNQEVRAYDLGRWGVWQGR